MIFDFDGVLVNSEPLHYRALRAALEPEGIEVGEEEYRRHYLAYDDWQSIRLALERHGQAPRSERVRAIAGRKAAFFEAMRHEVPFFPGARELVRSLSGEVPLAIASGARRSEIERILVAGGLRQAFAAVVGAEDVRRSKPDPEPYLAALAVLGGQGGAPVAGRCLVFEDTPPGIASALAAGMKVVAVAHTYPEALLSAAHRVVASLEGLEAAQARALFDSC